MPQLREAEVAWWNADEEIEDDEPAPIAPPPAPAVQPADVVAHPGRELEDVKSIVVKLSNENAALAEQNARLRGELDTLHRDIMNLHGSDAAIEEKMRAAEILNRPGERYAYKIGHRDARHAAAELAAALASNSPGPSADDKEASRGE